MGRWERAEGSEGSQEPGGEPSKPGGAAPLEGARIWGLGDRAGQAGGQ